MVDDVPDQPLRGPPVPLALSGLFLEAVSVDGASIAVVAGAGSHSVISSSSTTAAAVERRQFTLGEGPHWDALTTGRPVLAGDLVRAGASRWPILTGEMIGLGVGAMFSFPMTLGLATVGVVDLHRTRVGDLTIAEQQRAVSLTRSIIGRSIRTAVSEADSAAPSQSVPELRREVHQATGMLAAQMETTATNAFATLRAYSFANDRPIDDVAADIVHRRLNISEPTQ